MSINIIAAIGLNKELGYDNQLLVKLPSDMKHFKQLTTSGNHNICVMGRKTHQSIGRILSDRINIVLTKDKNYKSQPGVLIYHDVQKLLKEYQSYGEGKVDLWICGGAEIYKLFLPYANHIYLTIIDHQFNHCDTFFPQFNLSEWKVTSHITNKVDENNQYDHHFITYERKSNAQNI